MPYDAANLSNTHIVDQYADVLDQIKALNKIKADLAKQISAQIKDGNALTGDQYQATQSMHERVGSIDPKALLLDGIEVDAYRKPNTAVYRLDLTPLPA